MHDETHQRKDRNGFQRNSNMEVHCIILTGFHVFLWFRPFRNGRPVTSLSLESLIHLLSQKMVWAHLC